MMLSSPDICQICFYGLENSIRIHELSELAWYSPKDTFVQSAGAVEYTDCFSA